MPSTAPMARTLVQDLAQLLVLEHLALDPLERVVDRLRVACEELGHLLVGRALEVELQRVGLQLREAGAEAEDEALQLLGRDDADRWIVDARPGKCVTEGAVAVRVLSSRRLTERHVRVERRMLEARRGLDRRDDLPRNTELGE